MSDSLWPLKLLIAGFFVAFMTVLLLLAWAVAVSALPLWLKWLLYSLICSFVPFGASRARRRYRDGRSPWAMKETQRG